MMPWQNKFTKGIIEDAETTSSASFYFG